MNALMRFFKDRRYIVTWTFWYIAAMWMIFFGMFRFNIFDIAHWHRLWHAELHGFAGFVFGLILITAIPIYISICVIMFRSNKPLYTSKILSRIKSLLTTPPQTPAPAPTPEPEITTATATPAPTLADAVDFSQMPADMPSQMRGAYLRARTHHTPYPHATWNIPTPTATDTTTATDSEIPLPTDFDIDTEFDDVAPAAFSTPVFTEINFDSPTEKILNH